MSQHYASDHRVLSRYLDGKLTASELESFEAHWVENPEVIDDLEADARLQTGLAHLQHTGELNKIRRTPLTRFVTSIALAATLAAIAIALVLRVQAPSVKDPVVLAESASAFGETYGENPQAAEVIDVLHTRSELYDGNIELPDRPVILELRVLPDRAVTPELTYYVNLFEVSGVKRQEIASAGNLRAAKEGTLSVFVDTQWLQPGIYELQLRAEDELTRFTLNVLPSTRR